jgi:hypothetical protein
MMMQGDDIAVTDSVRSFVRSFVPSVCSPAQPRCTCVRLSCVCSFLLFCSCSPARRSFFFSSSSLRSKSSFRHNHLCLCSPARPRLSLPFSKTRLGPNRSAALLLCCPAVPCLSLATLPDCSALPSRTSAATRETSRPAPRSPSPSPSSGPSCNCSTTPHDQQARSSGRTPLLSDRIVAANWTNSGG